MDDTEIRKFVDAYWPAFVATHGADGAILQGAMLRLQAATPAAASRY